MPLYTKVEMSVKVQWRYYTSIVSATEEAKVGGSLEHRSSKPVGKKPSIKGMKPVLWNFRKKG
jgi:hypothetical protein